MECNEYMNKFLIIFDIQNLIVKIINIDKDIQETFTIQPFIEFSNKLMRNLIPILCKISHCKI